MRAAGGSGSRDKFVTTPARGGEVTRPQVPAPQDPDVECATPDMAVAASGRRIRVEDEAGLVLMTTRLAPSANAPRGKMGDASAFDRGGEPGRDRATPVEGGGDRSLNFVTTPVAASTSGRGPGLASPTGLAEVVRML